MFDRGAKSIWTLVLLILAGIVVGGFIGEYASTLPYMAWLNYGNDFGLTSPLVLDLGIFWLSLGFTIKFTISGIIGIIIAVIIYRKWL